VREAQRLVELDAKLPAVLSGKTKLADAAERIKFAKLLSRKQLYADSARFYKDAFTAQPKLANQGAHPRYDAACSAALAGCGGGQDAGRLDPMERARLRRQALDWLHAELATWTKELESNTAGAGARVRQMLQHWQRDSDLAGLRDPAEAAKLPAAEQAACRKLWQEVATLLRKVR
jgi:serine/threonine-protein kinase